jgi:uncharacterized protein
MPKIEQARSWYHDADPVHGFDHVLRVYHLAERLAMSEGADLEIVRAAVLLHDAESSDPEGENTERTVHHQAAADFARQILQAEGWPEARIAAVQHCIRAHRFRDDSEQPQTLEAKILFDADKLDAIGAIGVARAIAYAARDGQPAFRQPSERFLKTGEKEPGEGHSSYHEFIFKLQKLKERMYTSSGRALAEERNRFMSEFYKRLQAELLGDQ